MDARVMRLPDEVHVRRGDQDRCPDAVQLLEGAHQQRRRLTMLPNDAALVRQGNGGMQMMRLTAQPLQLYSGVGQLARLIE